MATLSLAVQALGSTGSPPPFSPDDEKLGSHPLMFCSMALNRDGPSGFSHALVPAFKIEEIDNTAGNSLAANQLELGGVKIRVQRLGSVAVIEVVDFDPLNDDLSRPFIHRRRHHGHQQNKNKNSAADSRDQSASVCVRS